MARSAKKSSARVLPSPREMSRHADEAGRDICPATVDHRIRLITSGDFGAFSHFDDVRAAYGQRAIRKNVEALIHRHDDAAS